MRFKHTRYIIILFWLSLSVLILNHSLFVSYVKSLFNESIERNYEEYVKLNISSSTIADFDAEKWISSDVFNSYELLPKFDELETQPHKSESWRQIFFIETSQPDGGFLEINERQACAIESAAKLHIDYNVYVLFVGPMAIDPKRKSTGLFLNLKKNYNNIFLTSINVANFTKETPLESFFKERKLKRTSYFMVYLADILRLVALWKYGGLYFDTDVVVLKNFKNLGDNLLCIASKDYLMTGTLRFSGEGIGHELVTEFLDALMMSFSIENWASNGPVLVTNVMKEFCNVTKTLSLNTEKCRGIKILKRETFLPIEYKNHLDYFTPAKAKKTMWVLKNSYTAHIFNHLNHELKLKTNSQAAYVQLAEKYCPRTFHYIGDLF